jgi:hypothetical protein
MEDLSNYQKLKSDALDCYNAIGTVFSPAFKVNISFQANGFHHLIFKNSHHIREESSQVLRFKLLTLAVKLIGLSTTYQEFEESYKEFLIKSYKKKSKKFQIVKYWGIIAIIDNRKIKVVLRKIGDNGNIHFWSIVPAWVTNKHRDIKLFTTMKGNPEED